jgi:hypothetical protein
MKKFFNRILPWLFIPVVITVLVMAALGSSNPSSDTVTDTLLFLEKISIGLFFLTEVIKKLFPKTQKFLSF